MHEVAGFLDECLGKRNGRQWVRELRANDLTLALALEALHPLGPQASGLDVGLAEVSGLKGAAMCPLACIEVLEVAWVLMPQCQDVLPGRLTTPVARFMSSLTFVTSGP